MSRCVVVGASVQNNFRHIQKFINDDDFIICADGGYDLIKPFGLTPDLLIGDFDSTRSEEDVGVKKIILPREKDLTDVNAAVEHGLGLGYKNFLLLCCTGNRYDHHYTNVCMLEYLAENDARGMLADEKNIIVLHAGGTMVFKNDENYKYISVAALDEKISGVTYAGLKYPLRDAELFRSAPIGISNEFIAGEATIEIKRGKALIIRSGD